ncbi:beta-ketoacyl-[acyl-carrier-protein] synthase family protein [Streptomyces sp. NPDC001514]
MTTGPISVTGLGLVTPAGIGTETTWHTVCAGTPTAATDPALAGLAVDFSCRVPGFDPRRHTGRPETRRLGRFTQLALAAAAEAVADAGLDPAHWDGESVAVVVGNAAGDVRTVEEQHLHLTGDGPALVSPLTLPVSLPNMVAGQLAIAFGARGPSLQVSTACAAGASAIGLAAALLRAGSCRIALAGGTEAVITRLYSTAFANMGTLSRRRDDPRAASRPFDADRDGFVMGEGAGFMVLERAADVRRRGGRGHAELAGYGATTDALHPVAPDPEAVGFRRAIRLALEQARVSGRDIDHVNAHGTGTLANDRAEAAALAQVVGSRAAVTSTKGVTGHLLGAAGAVEAVLTVRALTDQLVPPTANLEKPDAGVDLDLVTDEARKHPIDLAMSTSLGFGGHNAVLLFR